MSHQIFQVRPANLRQADAGLIQQCTGGCTQIRFAACVDRTIRVEVIHVTWHLPQSSAGIGKWRRLMPPLIARLPRIPASVHSHGMAHGLSSLLSNRAYAHRCCCASNIRPPDQARRVAWPCEQRLEDYCFVHQQEVPAELSVLYKISSSGWKRHVGSATSWQDASADPVVNYSPLGYTIDEGATYNKAGGAITRSSSRSYFDSGGVPPT